MGLKPTNRAALDAGNQHHARKAVAERIAGWLVTFGRVLIVVALLLILLWVPFR
jgi:hypothetical protein